MNKQEIIKTNRLIEVVKFYAKRDHWMSLTENAQFSTLLIAGMGRCESLDGYAPAQQVLDELQIPLYP